MKEEARKTGAKIYESRVHFLENTQLNAYAANQELDFKFKSIIHQLLSRLGS